MRRYREGFASPKDAEKRRAELLAINARSGMDGVCTHVWGEKARAGAASAGIGALRGGLVSLAAEFVAVKERAGRRGRTTKNLEHRLDTLAAAVGDVPPRQIKPAQIQRLLDASRLSARSRINNALVWRNFFRWCVRAGHCDSSPMQRVEMPSAERRLPATMPARMVARLIAATWRDGGTRKEPGPMLAQMLLLFFSGVRPEEVNKLTWAAFSWDRGEVVLDEAATKTSRVRHCRLDPRLVRVLKVLKERGDVPGYWSRRMFRRVRERAGCSRLNDWAVDIGRHTYASTRFALGAPEAELAYDMGNSVAVLRSHYINRLVSRAEAEKCWRVLDAVASRLAPIPKASKSRRPSRDRVEVDRRK